MKISCIPGNPSMSSTILTQAESLIEESSVERRRSRSYQIFPEANMDKDLDYASYSEDLLYRRERLPSIVVEPMEHSTLESGELCWRPRYQMSNSVDEEEDSSGENTEVSVDGEQQEDVGAEGCIVARKSSIGPSQSQLSISRLTPPPSPTPPESAPPCMKSSAGTTSMD